jgi:hypothetical protein
MTVKDLLQNTTPFLNEQDGGAAMQLTRCVNAISMALTKYLWRHKSDLIVKRTGIVTFRAGVVPAIVGLPSDYLGLATLPCIEGTDTFLAQTDTYGAKDYIGDTGEPEYFRITGTKIQVWPAPIIQTKVEVEYYAALPEVSGLEDSIPMTPLFDEVYVAGTIKFSKTGYIPTYEKEFGAMLANAVRDVVFLRSGPDGDFTASTY